MIIEAGFRPQSARKDRRISLRRGMAIVKEVPTLVLLLRHHLSAGEREGILRRWEDEGRVRG